MVIKNENKYVSSQKDFFLSKWENNVPMFSSVGVPILGWLLGNGSRHYYAEDKGNSPCSCSAQIASEVFTII